MNIVLIIIAFIVAFFIADKVLVEYKLYSAKSKLGNLSVSEKYKTIFDTITQNDMFFKNYRIVKVKPIQDNLISLSHPNIIIMLSFYEDQIRMTWKYMFFQKEVVRVFHHHYSNFSEQEQKIFALNAYKEMDKAISDLQNGVLF